MMNIHKKMGIPLYKIISKYWYIAALVVLPVIMLILVPALQELTIPVKNTMPLQAGGLEWKYLEEQKIDMERSIGQLEAKINAYTPRSPFLVINTSDNRFFLYKNRRLYREGSCSTGSYILLQSENRQKWLFSTPRGKFRIQAKITAPVWKKPDWAFVELGLPIPPEHHHSRYEFGVLGEYALSLGQGYLIHGTLYKRFLGLPVTHGCVRLNDEDLEAIYQSLQVGSRVYIY